MSNMLGLLLCLFGGAAGIGDLVKLDIKGGVGHWGAISMSTDGSKVIGTSLELIWTSTDGATTWTASSVAANDVLVTPDGSKMFALTKSTVGERIRVSTDDGSTWSDTGSPNVMSWMCMATNTDGSKIVAAGTDSPIMMSSDSGGLPRNSQTLVVRSHLG